MSFLGGASSFFLDDERKNAKKKQESAKKASSSVPKAQKETSDHNPKKRKRDFGDDVVNMSKNPKDNSSELKTKKPDKKIGEMGLIQTTTDLKKRNLMSTEDPFAAFVNDEKEKEKILEFEKKHLKKNPFLNFSSSKSSTSIAEPAFKINSTPDPNNLIFGVNMYQTLPPFFEKMSLNLLFIRNFEQDSHNF